MSWLSKVTGVHISPHGVHVEPLKALGTALTVGSFGGLGPLAGIAGKVGSAASHIPGASAVGGYLASKLGRGENTGGVHLDPETGLEVMDEGDSGGGIGGYLKRSLGDINPVTAGLGALGVVNSAQLGAKANKYANEAYGSASDSYAERAGLRKAGINGMMNPQAPDLSNLTRIRSSNPYAGLPLARAS